MYINFICEKEYWEIEFFFYSLEQKKMNYTVYRIIIVSIIQSNDT